MGDLIQYDIGKNNSASTQIARRAKMRNFFLSEDFSTFIKPITTPEVGPLQTFRLIARKKGTVCESSGGDSCGANKTQFELKIKGHY
jgi:hypothetical protein